MNPYPDNPENQPQPEPVREDWSYTQRLNANGQPYDELELGRSVFLSPEGAVVQKNWRKERHYHCGHGGEQPMGGKCSEPGCFNVSCASCFTRCCKCQISLCLFHVLSRRGWWAEATDLRPMSRQSATKPILGPVLVGRVEPVRRFQAGSSLILMNGKANKDFFEQLHQARAHGALNDRLGKRLLKVLQCDPHDALTRELLESRLRRVDQDLKAGRLPPFRQARLFEGHIVLGQDLHGVPIRIFLDWLCSGMLTVANTGSGKSTLVFWIASQLALLVDQFSTWLFEPYKTQLRLLLPMYQRAGKALIVLPWQNWRVNLLQCPPGSNPHHHATSVADVLVRTLDLPGRAASILRQAIQELYGKFGVADGHALRFPTLFHLYEYVRGQREINVAAKDAILDRLGAFLVALTPNCGAWTHAWNYDDLARYNIVFELRGAAESVRSVLPQSLLFGVFNSRIAAGLVNCPLQILLVFDDGQRVFSERGASHGEMTPLDELAGIIRGAGIGLWPIIQTTVGFSPRLRPNMAIKLFGRLGCHEDLVTLAADCGLNSEQVDYLRHSLVPGTFVGQIGLGNYTRPFIFRVPRATLPAALTEEEVRASQAPLNSLPTEFAEEFARWTPSPSVEFKTEVEPTPVELNESELQLLRAIVAEPGKSVSHYCRQARFNGNRLAQLRKRLVAQGFIREHRIATRTRGRAAIVLEPLPPAFQFTPKTTGKL